MDILATEKVSKNFVMGLQDLREDSFIKCNNLFIIQIKQAFLKWHFVSEYPPVAGHEMTGLSQS